MAKVLSFVNLYTSPSLGEITSKRSIATLPLLGRYSFIDIPLSNFSNSGFDTIGILAKDNFLDLNKHLSNSMTYSNNTKTGKTVLCYNESYLSQTSNTDLNNLIDNEWILKDSNYQYVIIAPCHIIFTIDFNKYLKKHAKSGASVSILYKRDYYMEKYDKRKTISLSENKMITSFDDPLNNGELNNYSLDTYIINIDKLFTALEREKNLKSNISLNELIASSCNTQFIQGIEFKGEVEIVDFIKDYYNTTKKLLEYDYLRNFFTEKWEILTRTYDTPPAMYLKNANVKNSYVSNGSIIDGIINNSVICRKDIIHNNVTIEDSIIFNNCEIYKNSHLKNVILDKGCNIIHARDLSGNENEPLYLKENQYYCDLSICLISSESNPFFKVGGLADVVYSLGEEFALINCDVSIIVPYYHLINSSKYNVELKEILNFNLSFNNKNIEARILSCKYKNINYYFIQSDQYFNSRDNIYGYSDDVERFSFFQVASLKFIQMMNFKFDIIHLHDWETGMIPLLYKQFYFKNDEKNPKFIYTIHNNKYIGNMAKEYLMPYFNLDDKFFDEGICRYNDKVSFLKTGVITTDVITTVSNTYVKELLDGSDGIGFKDIYNLRKNDFIGILNGIDYDEWNPVYDQEIEYNYSYETVKRIKKLNKKFLLSKYHFKEPELPLVIVISRLTSQKGIDLIIESLKKNGIKDYNLFILGMGDKIIENELLAIQKKYCDNFELEIKYSNELAHQLYASADYFIIPSRYEPCGLIQMISHRYGTLPIARATGGLIDTIISYNGSNELIADGFLFNNFDADELNDSLNKAIDLYNNQKKIYNKLVINAMKVDHSWHKSSKDYISLYINTIDN